MFRLCPQRALDPLWTEVAYRPCWSSSIPFVAASPSPDARAPELRSGAPSQHSLTLRREGSGADSLRGDLEVAKTLAQNQAMLFEDRNETL